MASYPPEQLAVVAEAGWRWVLDQVRWEDDGPAIPAAVADDGTTTADEEGLPTGMHSGIGGLAHVLAEIRLSRGWTDEERHLADGIAGRVRAGIPTSTNPNLFDGLASDVGVLIALGADSATAVARLSELADDEGWPCDSLKPPTYLPGSRINDATLGSASVLLGATWAARHAVPGARGLAADAADVLLAEAEQEPSGLNWRYVPLRHRTSAGYEMPNWSHGLAGIANVLALAGIELARPDLVDAARRGAEHLVTLGDTGGDGFRVPTQVPRPPGTDTDEFAYGWCHGASGTSRLFPALAQAGIDDVAGSTPATWERRCLHGVRGSGLPERLRPGFWDNDGRCCGTVGVGEVFLDAFQRYGDPDDRAFALHLADALVDRAYREGPHAWWRYLEHRRPEPLLPPGVGWMQGAAGIAAYLFRAARVARDGREASAVARMDNWWTVPPAAPAG
jgi:hypothetical protein